MLIITKIVVDKMFNKKRSSLILICCELILKLLTAINIISTTISKLSRLDKNLNNMTLDGYFYKILTFSTPLL